MRKFYSLVLMAAGLLIGTNSWAAVFEGTTGDELQEAINHIIDGSVSDPVIVLNNNVTLSDPIWIGPADGSEAGSSASIVLDLGGNIISRTSSAATEKVYMFVLGKGTLEIKNGKIKQLGSAEASSNVFTVYGTYTKTASYSHLIIDEDVEVSAVNGTIISVMEKSIDKKNDKYKGAYGEVFADPSENGFVTDYLSKGEYGFAFGVEIDVKGKLTVAGGDKTYGIKTNGYLGIPTGAVKRTNYDATKSYEAWMQNTTIDASYEDYIPYVHVWPTAKISSDNGIAKSSAIYASGYAKWLVEGECTGNIGASISSGQVEFHDATITSNSTLAPSAPNGESSVSGSCIGIVINSRSQMAGNMDVTITGETTVTSNNGHAIEERVNTSNSETKVQHVTIESGTITGGAQGAIVVSSTAQTTVYGATIQSIGDEPIVIAGDGNINDLLPSTASGAGLYTQETVGGKTVLVFNAAFNVTLNAAGLATFSAVNAVKLPAGLVAYRAVQMSGNDLEITTIGGADCVLPANTGVLLYGEANAEFVLYASGDDATVVGDNLMKPATDFETAYNNNEDIYILHGNELYLYTGDEFKANKAFFSLNSINPGTPAPQRIRMIVNEAQGVENVEVEAVKAEKFYENGQLFIRRGAEVYNVQGQLVK